MKPLDPRLVQRSRTVRTHLVWSVALGGLTALLVIGTAWAIARIVALHFVSAPLGLTLVLAVLGAYVLRAAIAWLHSVVSERASIKVKHDLRNELIDDLLDPRRVGARPEGARLSALLGPGMDAFDGYIGRFIPQLALAVVVPAMVVVAIAVTDLTSALIIIATLPLVGVFMALVGWMTQDKVARRWAQMERLAGHFADVLDGLVVLKVFGRDQEKSLRTIGEQHRSESMAALRLAFLSSLVLELISTISVALVAVGVGLRVVDSQMALLPAMFVLVLAPEAYLPVRRVGMMFHDSAEGATAAAEVLDVLDHERHAGTVAPPHGPAVVSVRYALVRYPDRNLPALQVDAVDILPGEFVAVTGPSGAGKSTFLDVLLGFLVLDEGQVLIDGTALDTIDIEAWRRNIAWVPQSPGIVSGTVADNVALGSEVGTSDESVRDSDVADALRDAGLSHMSPTRELREGGIDISAGERRRIGIARALLRVRRGGAWLMLLDEPTAGLDVDREIEVLAKLRDQDATLIVVAHRAETIAAADRVITISSLAHEVLV